MFPKILAALVIGVGCISANEASADSQVKANQIVDYFVKAKLGKERGLCIGTVEECDKTAPKPSLDMLINFDLDSANLTPQAKQNLEEFAKALANDQLASARFVVEGYTDARGTEKYNLGLSERRAEAVTKFLLDNGVSQQKVSAIGMGEAKPRVPDPLDPANRRVEMRIDLQ